MRAVHVGGQHLEWQPNRQQQPNHCSSASCEPAFGLPQSSTDGQTACWGLERASPLPHSHSCHQHAGKQTPQGKCGVGRHLKNPHVYFLLLQASIENKRKANSAPCVFPVCAQGKPRFGAPRPEAKEEEDLSGRGCSDRAFGRYLFGVALLREVNKGSHNFNGAQQKATPLWRRDCFQQKFRVGLMQPHSLLLSRPRCAVKVCWLGNQAPYPCGLLGMRGSEQRNAVNNQWSSEPKREQELAYWGGGGSIPALETPATNREAAALGMMCSSSLFFQGGGRALGIVRFFLEKRSPPNEIGSPTPKQAKT